MKHCTKWPSKGFNNLDNVWVNGFVQWHNEKHFQSGISFVTPLQRHQGDDVALLEHQYEVYEKAKEANPLRWSSYTRNWQHIREVSLNSEKQKAARIAEALAA